MKTNVSLYDILIINLMRSISFSHEFRITSINYRWGNILEIFTVEIVSVGHNVIRMRTQALYYHQIVKTLIEAIGGRRRSKSGWTENHKTSKTQSIRKWIIVLRLIVIRILAFLMPFRHSLYPSFLGFKTSRSTISFLQWTSCVQIYTNFFFLSITKKFAANKFKWKYFICKSVGFKLSRSMAGELVVSSNEQRIWIKNLSNVH